jgi:flagellar L-ring protein precursor FlgH
MSVWKLTSMNVMRTAALLLLAVLPDPAVAALRRKKKMPEPSPLDRYVAEAVVPPSGQTAVATSGSLWTPGALLGDVARDLKASQVNDLVTVVVAERASAVSSGATKTQRKSSVNSSVAALGGITRAAGPLANLAKLGGEQTLDGDGSTSRSTTQTTTVSARVVRVLPNGYMLLEGTKDIQVNSEHQRVVVRGIARPADVNPDNSVRSDRLAQMEVFLNGKGVVADSIRRPFILYRLLMGILPF